ncbi:hypothetical protein PGTUg99_007589 [Puccinia graminis f. sp. tritici]|uniref:Uncharacterized protein n=1 Tax=Puccinia graminis f. sp. tritici TaxID=56615 RepID=A0A5B0P291_PUCGR|nr:hypothetical protein PGTUg99_007589 [Puccinia graminis f. sp. tritici]
MGLGEAGEVGIIKIGKPQCHLQAAQGKKDQASRASDLSLQSPDRRNLTLDKSDNDQHSQTPLQPSPAFPNPSSSQDRCSKSQIEGFPSPNQSSSQTRCSESPALPNPSSTEDQHSQSLINPALPQSQDSESPVNSAFHETTESDQPLNALSQDSEPTLNATSPREQDDRDSDLPENSVLLNQQDPIKIQGKMSFLVPPLLKIKETGARSPPETMTWNRRSQALASSQALKRKSKDPFVWPDPSQLSWEQLEEYLDECNVPHTPTACLARLIGSYNFLCSSLPILGEQQPSKHPKATQSGLWSSSWLPRRRSQCRVKSGSDANNHGLVYSWPDPPSSPPVSASSQLLHLTVYSIIVQLSAICAIKCGFK